MPSPATYGKRSAVRGIGEIAFRANNRDAMQRFYQGVIGLPLMTRVPNCAFFKIADGYMGHTQVRALFDRSQSPGYRGTDAATSTIDHNAFEVALTDFGGQLNRLKGLGLQVEMAEQAWVHWRLLYVADPEGNQVELVATTAVCEERPGRKRRGRPSCMQLQDGQFDQTSALAGQERA
jgi:catechol-2,3-dioxygenase